jgi:hypothetical protein
VDPLAHKFPHQIGYAFTDKNPINLIDPTGLASIDPEEGYHDPPKPPLGREQGPETLPPMANPHIQFQ